MNIYESRCGICCNVCERKEEVNCQGCIHMEMPFWGSACGVKSCCEEKGLGHCGECGDFPCEMLANMGKEQGYDPAPRLEKCRQWARLKLRTANRSDLQAITQVEAVCFPEAEAAKEADFRERIQAYGHHFWLLEENGKLISFINGMVIDEETICDEMYENVRLHKEDGDWQTIFGINTIPERRRQGYGEIVMRQMIEDAKAQERKGCVLTCKEELIPYYEKFGYKNYGLSKSAHGGAVWYDMRLEF